MFDHIDARLARIEAALVARDKLLIAIAKGVTHVIKAERQHMSTLDDILAKANAQGDLLNQIAADIRSVSGSTPADQAKIDQIASALDGSNGEMQTLIATLETPPAPAAPSSGGPDVGQQAGGSMPPSAPADDLPPG